MACVLLHILYWFSLFAIFFSPPNYSYLLCNFIAKNANFNMCAKYGKTAPEGNKNYISDGKSIVFSFLIHSSQTICVNKYDYKSDEGANVTKYFYIVLLPL